MNNKTVFVAVDIGCIECGEDSNVLGIFATKEQAVKGLFQGERHFKSL